MHGAQDDSSQFHSAGNTEYRSGGQYRQAYPMQDLSQEKGTTFFVHLEYPVTCLKKNILRNIMKIRMTKQGICDS
jgi:hypothetical protein